MKIVWTALAKAGVEEIFEWLCERDAKAAIWTLRALQSAPQRLARTPGIGRPGRVLGTRETRSCRTSSLTA
jgi:plasmid stabilization system protein ParE